MRVLRLPRLAVLVVCAIALTASAQEENSCAEHVTSAVTPLHEQLSSVTANLGKVTAERDALHGSVTSSKEEYATLYAAWQKQAEEIASLKGTHSECSSKLNNLQSTHSDCSSKLSDATEQLLKASSKKLDIPTIATALAAIAKESALSAVATSKAVFEELKDGKTDRLSAVVGDLLSTTRGVASSVVAFVTAQVDQHLPEPVKQQISTHVAKAQALWKEHVTDAAWAQPMLKQFSSVNEELKKVVGSTLASTPALAPLADPVTVQLLAYSVFALPVVLLLVLPLALAGGKKKPETDTRGPAGKGGKKKTKSTRA